MAKRVPDISVVIPFLDEQENLSALLDVLVAYCAQTDFRVEAVFVDDGSTDESLKILKRYSPQNYAIKIVKLSKNYGTHSALRAGFLKASAGLCMCYFADMQEPITIIGDFFAELSNGYDIVYETRSNYQPSFFSKLYTQLLRKIIANDFPEKGIGCFAFNGKVKNYLNNRIEANSSIHIQLFTIGFKRKELPYTTTERKSGVSKWTLSKKINLFVDTFIGFSNVPIRMVTIIGFLVAIIGILYALFIVTVKISGIMYLEAGYPTLISTILFGFGLTNMSLGIIAEYLWRTLDGVRNRPAFIIDEVLDEQ